MAEPEYNRTATEKAEQEPSVYDRLNEIGGLLSEAHDLISTMQSEPTEPPSPVTTMQGPYGAHQLSHQVSERARSLVSRIRQIKERVGSL
jgi:hypothetical protein